VIPPSVKINPYLLVESNSNSLRTDASGRFCLYYLISFYRSSLNIALVLALKAAFPSLTVNKYVLLAGFMLNIRLPGFNGGFGVVSGNWKFIGVGG